MNKKRLADPTVWGSRSARGENFVSHSPSVSSSQSSRYDCNTVEMDVKQHIIYPSSNSYLKLSTITKVKVFVKTNIFTVTAGKAVSSLNL